MKAFIAYNWYPCDTKPNLEIADHAVMAAKASGVQRYIASAVWWLGKTDSSFQLGNHDTSYNHNLPPGEVESKRLGGLCGIDLVENARFTLITS
jgi:hypothetical protein